MERTLFRTLFKNPSPSSLHKLIPFSTYSPSLQKLKTSKEEEEGGSSVYRHALKYQRPSTIKWIKQFHQNSIHLIGSVCSPVNLISGKNRLGIHTTLRVSNHPLESNHTFRIMLQMWDEMAMISLQHLKPNDFIYVSGQLECFTKADVNGTFKTYYKVIVQDLNHVAQHSQSPNSPKFERSESEGGAGTETSGHCLHLWQWFFANPMEWWDNRKQKLNPKSPDFRHKEMHEALWISPDDPLWIKRQLQLHDLRMAEKQLHLWQLFFANPMEWWDNRKKKKYPKEPDFTHKDTREALWINPDDPPWIARQLQLHDMKTIKDHLAGAGKETTENRLHLWQMFFANPTEWWDNRKLKLNPNAPDFKHKDISEALWIRPDDPPWIKRQLQLLDSRMAEEGHGEHVSPRHCLSTWRFDDFK